VQSARITAGVASWLVEWSLDELSQSGWKIEMLLSLG